MKETLHSSDANVSFDSKLRVSTVSEFSNEQDDIFVNPFDNISIGSDDTERQSVNSDEYVDEEFDEEIQIDFSRSKNVTENTSNDDADMKQNCYRNEIPLLTETSSLYLNILLNGVEVSGLLDTGSQVTIISNELAKKLKLETVEGLPSKGFANETKIASKFCENVEM